jgi:3',5'-cyclic AMP phosphodiesterase CpdA
MAAEHARHRFDALLLLGDNVYPDGDPALVERVVLEPFQALLDDGVPLLAVLGNHDVGRGEGDLVAARLGMPARWYEAVLGPVHLLALDSTQVGSRAQRRWLAAALARSPGRFRIVALHHPPWSAGWHGSSRDVRRAWSGLFRRHDVDLVLAGHEHDYQRSRPIRGVTYVISGAATHLRPTGRRRFTAAAHAAHHFVDLAVHRDRLVLRAVGHGGVELDRVVIGARAPAAMSRPGAGVPLHP